MAMPELNDAAASGGFTIESLLDQLPVALCRWDLPGGVPSTAPAEAICEALQRGGRMGYANPAYSRLAGPAARPDVPDAIRSALVPAGCAVEPMLLRRFVAGGLRLTGVRLRLPGPNAAPQVVEGTWHGAVVAGRLVAIWVILQDVTAERVMEHTAAIQRAAPGSEIIGESAAIRRVLEKIEQVAATSATVLIRGETGTGKELIAQAIHRGSPRHAHPMVAVNCGAIAGGLVESELFGHEKGAFTGAIGRKQGRFELADGGTLFLDEIGDLSLELQVKLLRVLQEGEIVRVGGGEPIRVDVRVIAATHRDLPALAQQGAFRQDLYYRLNVFPIVVPPLRERAGDIPLLIRHLTAQYATRLGKRIETIPQALIDRLTGFPWPGNIRELANLIERSVIVSPGPALELADWATGAHLPITAERPVAPWATPLLEVEREHILAALTRAGWRVSGAGGAADMLGLKPTTLEARMKKLGIARPGRP
jgi:transcriptional regulator with GAF, ATPase, and Fis domain